MTKVICDFSACEYWKDNVCQLEEIELADSCESYVLHTDVCKDHCHTFWKRVRNNEDGKAYRVESRGKRYKLLGLVWYTAPKPSLARRCIACLQNIIMGLWNYGKEPIWD